MTDEERRFGHLAVGSPAEGSQAEENADDSDVRPGEEMRTLMDHLDKDYRSPHRGEVIEGTVVSVDKDGIMVDVGTKSEGIIPGHEVQSAQQEFGEDLQVGDRVLVYVVQPENRDGHVVLSLRRARAERGWRQVQKMYEDNATIEAEVVDCNKGGLIVDVNGLRGFVPSSQVIGLRQTGTEREGIDERLTAMVGQRVPLKVLEINRKRNRLILSERAASQEIRQRRKEELLNELQPGELRTGRVSSICDFGVFVDLGGADGLVHISELSWSPTSHPSEVVSVGQEIEVQVISVDREKKKIALSLRRAKPEPWSTIAEQYNVGDEVQGRITKLASFGAFARIKDGVEGLIHISELSDDRIVHPKNVVKEGDLVNLKVIRVEPERRRLGLSMRQAVQDVPASEEAETSEPPADDAELAEAERDEPAAATPQAESSEETEALEDEPHREGGAQASEVQAGEQQPSEER